ncbi:hypothetical protein [Saccharothrix coeruleofusca]|uniref:Uncharacterized protein n=1 Tax=Saccharothrix coeruleofusca TaxID=33919 RepID=A0A918ECA6_9PSEU|nr:hypothetical protein [Saccharothrix coeruleofusca]GGP42111.1 hypothetical protein GCM10010185_11790 [Saccharothrix coeruleofusca]
MGAVGDLLRRLFGSGAPEGFTGALEPAEHVVASAATRDGWLVATSLGLWLPGARPRRLGWHLISKATWSGGALSVVEAVEDGAVGEVVVLRDLPPRRFALEEPGKLPEAVHKRVTGAIRSRHRHESPGAWFLRRRVPGRDGLVVQVRPDEGEDVERVKEITPAFVASLPPPPVD